MYSREDGSVSVPVIDVQPLKQECWMVVILFERISSPVKPEQPENAAELSAETLAGIISVPEMLLQPRNAPPSIFFSVTGSVRLPVSPVQSRNA